MRTSEELAAEIICRLEIANREKAARHRLVYSVCAALTCLLLIVGLAFFLPPLPNAAPNTPNAASATLIGAAGWGGYVIVGVAGVTLGVALTLFCLKMREKR